ncbi:hypothetical protein E27107_90226 [Elizabethkingia anophelis]|nr:hypothetical protein E18064_60377 [Elizabethkingia anophelis]CDN80138.1 hypothetical protein E27107_90226 [Elizabethkingia anophelis]
MYKLENLNIDSSTRNYFDDFEEILKIDVNR